MPPTMNRKQFERNLRLANSYGVWIQISPALQMLLPISKKTAREIAEEGLRIMPIWGQLCEDCLELSITSQWYDKYIEDKHGQT